ncbi:MAG: hypothetical protein ACYDDF_10680 [Thermoplasmatota archaeon]
MSKLFTLGLGIVATLAAFAFAAPASTAYVCSGTGSCCGAALCCNIRCYIPPIQCGTLSEQSWAAGVTETCVTTGHAYVCTSPRYFGGFGLRGGFVCEGQEGVSWGPVAVGSAVLLA